MGANASANPITATAAEGGAQAAQAAQIAAASTRIVADNVSNEAMRTATSNARPNAPRAANLQRQIVSDQLKASAVAEATAEAAAHKSAKERELAVAKGKAQSTPLN